LDDRNVHIRRGAIEALGPLQDRRAVEPVAKFLRSFHERPQAGEALVHMGTLAEAEVRKYLTDPNKGAREEAARVLRQLGKLGQDDDYRAALGGLGDANYPN